MQHELLTLKINALKFPTPKLGCLSVGALFLSRRLHAVAGRRDETELLANGPLLLGSLRGRGPAPHSRSRAARKVAPWTATRTMLPLAFLPWQTVQPPNMYQRTTEGNTSSVSCYATTSSPSTVRFVICSISHKTWRSFVGKFQGKKVTVPWGLTS